MAEPTIAQAIRPGLEPLVGETGARGVSIGLALAIATVAQMVLGELIPKTYAISRPLRSALVVAPPMRVYSVVFGPVIRMLNGAADWTVRRLGIEPTEELSSVRSMSELELLFASSAEMGTLDRKASRLLRRSIRFGRKTAADVLVPRIAIETVQVDETADDLVRRSRHTGYSRFPVYGADVDDIRGVVHIKQVHPIPLPDRATTTVGELMNPAVVVPETRELADLLVDIQHSRSHLVVVVDEYGGTEGIVTLEDLVEEIVGDIADEYDRPTDLTVVEQPGEYLLGGTLHLDEVYDVCGLEVPEGGYETLAGFVLDRLGHVPDGPGDSVVHDGWRLEVEEMDRLRIATVRVTRIGTPGDTSGAAREEEVRQ